MIYIAVGFTLSMIKTGIFIQKSQLYKEKFSLLYNKQAKQTKKKKKTLTIADNELVFLAAEEFLF